MDYSHFWWREQEIDLGTFEKIIKDFNKLLDEIKAVGVKLTGDPWNEKPVINSIEVRFNDTDKSLRPQNEPFYFPRVMEINEWHEPDSTGRHFERCKTTFKPYDLAVVAFLFIAKKHLGDAIEIHTDGTDDNWFDGKLICQVTLGYGYEYRIIEGILTNVTANVLVNK
jgi:hypothetical protein